MTSTTGPGQPSPGHDERRHGEAIGAVPKGASNVDKGPAAERTEHASSRHGVKTRIARLSEWGADSASDSLMDARRDAEPAPGAAAHAAARKRAAAAATEEDRRTSPRRPYEGTILIVWHHRPNDPIRLETIDVSEGGARVRTTCFLPVGMTGTAIELLGRAADAGDAHHPDRDEVVLERIHIGRTVTVAWSKAIRRDDGMIDHLEAGLRFY